MPQMPDGSQHKAFSELLHVAKEDHERWHRISDEVTRRSVLMGEGPAAESVLDDVRAGRL